MFTFLDKVSSILKTKNATGGPKAVTQKPVKQPIVTKQVKVEKEPKVDTAAIKAATEAQIREILLEAKDEALRIREEAQNEMRKKEEFIERRVVQQEQREEQVISKERSINERLAEIERIKQEQIQKLERVAHLTVDEAKNLILKAVEEKSKKDIAQIINQAQAIAKEEADKKVRELLVDGMRHGATNYVAEFTVSVVRLPDEEMKGKIIGKEGRNIRAFEQATGVDVDLEEEGVIRLSCFDSVRREIARVTLERLMKDGRIQPVKIEEILAQVKKDIERIMFEEGEKLCQAVGVFNLPRELIALLGRFKYRSSYGQNMITHTLEETKIGIALAREVKAEVNIVRLGCLLHDIGKVVTDEEGSHIELGVQLLRKYNIPQPVIDCVEQHHEDKPFSSPEAMLVYIADAISGSRPGARYEDVQAYVKRLTDLEAIAKSHEGVKDVFAYQAGRELRVMVDPGHIDDAAATLLSHALKEEIEKKLTYPGNIRITVVRETRAVDVAK